MKKLAAKAAWMTVAISILLGTLLTACSPQSGPEDPNVGKSIRLGIIQYATHPSLDAAREGFLDALKANGYEDGDKLAITLANGEGDQPTIRSIAQQFSEDEFDLILAIATPAAQAMANAAKETPILITAVTDPVSAGLVETLEKPNTNVTGTSDYVSVHTQLDMVRQIVPEAVRLGVIYNSGEENSQVQVEEVKAYAKDHGLTVIEATPTNSSEVLQAAQSLVGKVDAIYVPTDNTAVSGMEAIVKVCNEEKIPLFPAEGDSVARGGLASAGVDYYRLGKQTGEQALAIINGENPGDIPVEIQEEVSVIVNLNTARTVGVSIPQAVLDIAVDIIDE